MLPMFKNISITNENGINSHAVESNDSTCTNVRLGKIPIEFGMPNDMDISHLYSGYGTLDDYRVQYDESVKMNAIDHGAYYDESGYVDETLNASICKVWTSYDRPVVSKFSDCIFKYDVPKVINQHETHYFYSTATNRNGIVTYNNHYQWLRLVKLFNSTYSLEQVKRWVDERAYLMTGDSEALFQNWYSSWNAHYEEDFKGYNDEEYDAWQKRGYIIKSKYVPLAGGIIDPNTQEHTQAPAFAIAGYPRDLPLSKTDKKKFNHKSEFQYLHREVNPDELTFEATYDTELSAGQWTDIAIFGERLASALIGKR